MQDENNISPFGFHFEFDKRQFDRRRRQRRRQKLTRWFSWLAFYHHKFGVRHVVLVGLLAGYVFIGGAIFNAIEQPNEIDSLRTSIQDMERIVDETSIAVMELVGNCSNPTKPENRPEELKRLLKNYYTTMLQAEGRFYGSVWHKAGNISQMNLSWYFMSACFYAMTIFTTIGYGTIVCQTWLGRFLSVVYGVIGIPIMLVVLGDVGELLQRLFTSIYVYCLLKWK